MFHFTIRDVLWLTVVVAIAVAWCADRRTNLEATRIERDQARTEMEIHKRNFEATVAILAKEGFTIKGDQRGVSVNGPGILTGVEFLDDARVKR